MMNSLVARRRFLGLAACFAAVLMLSGCLTSNVTNEWPDIAYGKSPAVRVNAARLDIQDVYRAPMGAPNVDHLFKVTPSMAAQTLASRQVIPVGGQNVMRVIVEDASVRRSTLPPKEGVLGLLPTEPDEQFDARVALRFELADEAAPDIVTGRASVVATRQRTLTGGATLAQREKAYHDIVQALVDDLSQGILTTVGGTFGQP